ncbi:MAG TPA: CoA-binding protein, partial [Ramlibacter sp.]|nr:CoA-binding protein [Ramlibacter sp.]
YPVHRTASEIQGLKAYPSLTAVGERVDLAIVAVPVDACAEAMDQIVSSGARAAVVFTSGFAETGEAGARGQRSMAEQARAHGVVLLGPNCLGAMNLHQRMFATFSPVALGGAPAPGKVALVSQSGAFGGYAYSLAREAGLGLGHWITTGNEAGVQVGDAIHWLAGRADCDVILAYMEGTRDEGRLRRALVAARDAGKPVAIVKVGHSEVGTRAARLHTGSDTGDAARYRILFDEYGVHQASSIGELFRVGYALARGRRPTQWRRNGPLARNATTPVAVLTISGGVGIMMADRAEEHGLRMPALPDAAAQRLLAAIPFAATANPIDVTGQVFSQPEVLVQVLADTARSGCYGYVAAFLAAASKAPGVWPLLQECIAGLQCDPDAAPLVMSGICTAEQRLWLEANGCLVFEEPAHAIDAVATLAHAAPHGRGRPSATARVPGLT